MAQTLVGSTPIKSSPDKFYGFFKNDMSSLVKVAPGLFKSVELVQGEDGAVGAVKIWKYVLAGVTLSLTVETVAMDDVARTITFEATEGDVLAVYKIFKFSVAVMEGVAQLTIFYEKAFIAAPPPDAYIAMAIAAIGLVDLYLLGT